MIPKAELHLHIEGMVPPDLVRKLAARNNRALPPDLFDPAGNFVWDDFGQFLNAYDKSAAAALRTGTDYRDITYDYLSRQAAVGGIYVEFFISSAHGESVGLAYQEMIDGIADGIRKAEDDHDITGRMIATAVRHLGPEVAFETAKTVVEAPHPYVTGFGMGGDEGQFDLADFVPAFALAAEAGLECTTHAGEVCGPQSVWDAIELLPVSRIGHGVRAVEDPALVQELAARDIVLEVCPGSNIALNIYDDPGAHPFKALRDAGVKVTLSSDDPPFFGTDLNQEYEQAQSWFGLSNQDLIDITRTAVEAAFVDEATRAKLLAKLTD